jgi:hypothetical protein
VFPDARHLNWMDNITSHVIQIDSNFRSLTSKVSDTRASDLDVSDSMVLEASDTKGLGGLRHLGHEYLVSNSSASNPRRGLGGSRLETFSGFDLCGL